MSRPVFSLSPALSHALTLSALLLSLGACHRPQAADELIADARRYRDQGDTKAAIIQLKNVVQQQPDHAGARLMLGQIYVESGDMPSAEKELRRARELGAMPETVLPALGKALLLQGQYDRLLKEIPDDPGNGMVLALRGHALLGLDRTEDARTQFRRALQRQPELSEATLGLARVALLANQPAQASQLVDQAIRQDPAGVEPLRMKGDLERARSESAAARQSYQKILTLKPNNVQARVDIANLDIQEGHFQDAREQIRLARKAQPNSLLIFYSQALLEFREGHYQASLDQLQQVLRAVPDHMPSLLLAGAVELAMGSNTQAEQYLNRYLYANPGNPYATKLLATIALRDNHADEALKLVRPLLKDTPDDVELLALAGEAEMRGRHFDEAAGYFQKASELKPDAPELRLAHGVSRLGLGENPRAIAELEQAGSNGPAGGRAGVLLVLTHLRGKQFDKALDAVDAMIRSGDNPMLQNLLHRVIYSASEYVI